MSPLDLHRARSAQAAMEREVAAAEAAAQARAEAIAEFVAPAVDMWAVVPGSKVGQEQFQE